VKIVVVGCGVSGLSCASRLLDLGHAVEIWTRDFPEDTTSSVAAAVWYPYQVGPGAKATGWALASYREFQRIAADPTSGVVTRGGMELFEDGGEDADWRRALDGFREESGAHLPNGYERGYYTEVPVIEMPIYLPWLVARVKAQGGVIRERTLDSLDAALAAADAVVNCTGLGSRELVGDAELVPIRGQIVRVKRGVVDQFLFDRNHSPGPTYIVPRSQDCVLGGTADEGREDLTPDADSSEEIRARCAELDPRVADAEVLSVGVGLRPGRAVVRLEAERVGGKLVVHDYGHGGAGVTMSWGCADEVAELVGPAT
jgi:D-amino-acid oxidase